MQRLPIIALFAANAISMVGNVLAMIAIPWFVLQTTGSATRTGITGFFTILPVILAGFLGGAFIDRLGYRRTCIIADLASGVTVALIPLLHFTIGLQFWQLMLLVFLGGLLDTPGGTARSAIVPDLAAKAGMPLERATSAEQVVERASRFVGAPLAGVLIAALGTANVLWLDAASFLVSAILVAAIIPGVSAKPKPATQSRYIDEIMVGLKFMGAHRLVLAMIIVVMITNFVDAAWSGVLLPVYVNRVFGSAVNLGIIVGVMGGGSVLGGILFGLVGHRLPRYATFVGMFILTSLYAWGFALFLPFPIILLLVGISGIAAGPLNPIIETVIFERVPADMRGRVLGSIQAGAWLTMPLGMLLAGVLADLLGMQILLFTLALTYMATTLSMLFIPVLRELNQRMPVSNIVNEP
jgi:MFS family permease